MVVMVRMVVVMRSEAEVMLLQQLLLQQVLLLLVVEAQLDLVAHDVGDADLRVLERLDGVQAEVVVLQVLVVEVVVVAHDGVLAPADRGQAGRPGASLGGQGGRGGRLVKALGVSDDGAAAKGRRRR